MRKLSKTTPTPVENMQMSEAVDTSRFREMLLAEKERLQKNISSFELNHLNGEGQSARLGELSDFDMNHPAEMASETFDRVRDMALETNDADLLSQVQQALLKIEKGTYGLCDRCGAPIPVERLEILPYATFCIRCQDILEGSGGSF